MSAKRKHRIAKVTLYGMIVNLILTGLKVTAGILGKSSAMIADGIHSLSDLLSDFVVLFFVNISSKTKDHNHNFGHGKFENLATLIISMLLILVGTRMFLSASSSVLSALKGEVLPVPGTIALWAALISIILKEVLFRVSYKIAKEEGSPALEANAWHHRSDAFSSVGVFMGIGGAILLGEKWAVLDPIASCFISIAIIVVAINMAAPSIKDLLDTSLPEDIEQDIIKTASEVPGVRNVHNLRTRRSGVSYIIYIHITVDPELSITEAHRIGTEVENLLSLKYGPETQVTTHIEPDIPSPDERQV